MDWRTPLRMVEGRPRERPVFLASAEDGGTEVEFRLRAWPSILVGRLVIDRRVRAEACRINSRRVADGSQLDYGVDTEGTKAVGSAAVAAVMEWFAAKGVRPEVRSIGIMGAAYVEMHEDEGFGRPGALFTVVSMRCGGDLFFPRLQLRVPFPAGTVVAFDPLNTHGITVRGGRRGGECSVLYVSADATLDIAAARTLGMVV